MSSYAHYLAAAADVEALSGTRLKWKLRQAKAELRAALPFLGDDIFVLIAAELDARMLGRLACAAQRFWRASVADPEHKGSAPPQLWSVAEEGARRQLYAHGEQVRGWVPRRHAESWMRRLHKAEKLLAPLLFTLHGPSVARCDAHGGAISTQVPSDGYSCVVCGGAEMTAGRFFAEMTVVKRGIASWPTFGVVKKDFPVRIRRGLDVRHGWRRAVVPAKHRARASVARLRRCGGKRR